MCDGFGLRQPATPKIHWIAVKNRQLLDLLSLDGVRQLRPAVRTRLASASMLTVSVTAPTSSLIGGTEYSVEASSLIPFTTEILKPALETSTL